MPSENPHINIFIAYSHKDKSYLNELLPYLNSLKRTQSAHIWYDGEIAPGAKWDEEIKKHLNDAHIILLLISVDALDSDYFHQEEMKRALERHELETAIVIPVILRPCMWKDEKIGSLQALPEEGKPIIEWSLKDSAYTNVARGIKDQILTIKNREQNAVAILAAQKKEQEDKTASEAKRQAAARQKEEEEQARKAATKQKEEQRQESIGKRKKQLFRLLRIGLPVLVGLLVVFWVGKGIVNYQRQQADIKAKRVVKEKELKRLDEEKKKREAEKTKVIPKDLIQNFLNDMVFIEGGKFKMGCTDEQSDCEDDEKPAHNVIVDDFRIGRYEVTNEQFCAFLNEKGNKTEGSVEWLDISDGDCKIEQKGNRYVPKIGYNEHPVIEVSWYGAKAFCKWLKDKTGKDFRLPTEAEWEYAARGGNQSKGYKYAGSNDIAKVAWYNANSGNKIHKVNSKVPNELGLYQMSGNVWEWCHDVYDEDYYKSSPQDNPKGSNSTDSAGRRVLRGGSWYYSSRLCRTTHRLRIQPDGWYYDVGFRVAQAP